MLVLSASMSTLVIFSADFQFDADTGFLKDNVMRNMSEKKQIRWMQF